jgi:AcrR family transcriptional regulator
MGRLNGMVEEVKPGRPYRSAKRRAQAAATRAEIADAAHALYLDRGYVSTTLADIAAAAGVAVPTVKAAYGTKAGVLIAVWERVAAPRSAEEQLTLLDPCELLRRKIARSLEVSARVAPLVEVIRAAAQVDAEVGALWDGMQAGFRDVQRHTVEALRRSGRLRSDLTPDEAADVLYVLNHGTYHQLVGRWGWTPQRYGEWLTRTLIEQLLAPERE